MVKKGDVVFETGDTYIMIDALWWKLKLKQRSGLGYYI